MDHFLCSYVHKCMHFLLTLYVHVASHIASETDSVFEMSYKYSMAV